MAYTDLNNKLDWAMSFQRTGTFPLDRSSMFSSYADALAYAKQDGTDERQIGGTSYIGQPITVYGKGIDGVKDEVALYIITSVGSSPELIKIATTSPSGDIDADLKALQQKVTQLEGKVTALETKDSPSREEFTGLEGKVTTNTESIGTVSDRVDTLETKIKDLTGAMHFVGTSTTDPSTGTVTIEGQPGYSPKSGDVVLYNKQEFIYDGSSWSIFGDEGSHITQDQADARYVQKTAYDLKVQELTQKDTELEGKITALEGAGYITETAADKKYVQKETDKSLVQNTLITKLEGLAEIKSVNANEFDINSETKELSIKLIEQSKVNGLTDALDAKADQATVDGFDTRLETIEGKAPSWDAKYKKPEKGIPMDDLATEVSENITHTNRTVLDQTTAAFTTELKSKLDGIQDNANNYTLPQATADTLGGIKAQAKSDLDTGYNNEIKIDTTSGKLYGKDTPVSQTVTESDTNAVSSKAVYTHVAVVDAKVNNNTTNIQELDNVIGTWMEGEQPIEQTVTERFKAVENTLNSCIRYELIE